jgi:hypothetical protein
VAQNRGVVLRLRIARYTRSTSRKKSNNMRDAIRDDGSTGSPATPRDAIDPMMSVRSKAKSFDSADTPGGAGARPEFRGDLEAEALFQMFVDIGDRKRVD